MSSSSLWPPTFKPPAPHHWRFRVFRTVLSCLHAHELLCLRAQSLEENVEICKKYLERMAKCNVLLEMELGVTGGEEDGVDNTDVDSSRLYTQP